MNPEFFEDNEGKEVGFFTYEFSNSEAGVDKLEQLRNLEDVAAVGLVKNLNEKLLIEYRKKGITDSTELAKVFSTKITTITGNLKKTGMG